MKDEDIILGVLGLAFTCFLIFFVLISAAFVLPFIGVGAVLWGGVYYYYHSPAYLEKKAREHTQGLYRDALARYQSQDAQLLAADMVERIPETPLAYEIAMVAIEIVKKEGIAAIPEPPLVCNSIEGARYRDRLSSITEFPSPERAKELLIESFTQFVHSLPDLAEDGPFAVPLITLLKEPGDTIEALILPLFEEKGLFPLLKDQLNKNAREVSGKKQDLIYPSNYEGENIAYAYLKDTPLLGLLDMKVPFGLPARTRFEHCIITGGTGHGKTQLLQTLILQDLQADASVVVVDSQGEMLENIARLDLLKDRDLIILDPRDNPALNIFDINQQRIGRYGEEQQEQVHNHTLETFSYLFNSLLGADLTVRQATLFNYVISLMLALPETLGRNATLLDMIKLMDDPSPYLPAVTALDPIAQEFFQTDFPSKQYTQTKEQIRYRLQAIIGNKTLARLFLAPENTVDFFTELNRGSVILIDTSKAFLGQKNSSYLGRIAISLILQAILERAAVSRPKYPVFLYVDEAGEYFDKSIDTFLTEARKQNAGLVMAHQNLGQMTPELRASVAANTSIKFAGGLSSQDAKTLAPDMRSDAAFLLSHPKLTFACYIRGHTPQAVPVSTRAGLMEKQERISDAEYQDLRTRNRARVSLPYEPPIMSDDAGPEDPDATDTAPGRWET